MYDISLIEHLITSTYHPADYPVSRFQIEKWSRTRPLQGTRILDATPVFRNTLVKHWALMAAGAELTVGISETVARDERIVELLRAVGVPIVEPEQTPLEMDLILDCAAMFRTWNPRIGFVELTRSGTEKFDTSTKPVYVADNGQIKRIETLLGTGESYFRAMQQLGYEDWKGRLLVVFGSGKVGSGIILQAHRMGAQVVVVTDPATIDPKIAGIASEIIHYRDSAAIANVVCRAYAVVTATGRANALEGNCPPEALLHSTALLANMGVEDEFGPSIPSERVLMQKKTLNFILEEPTHLKYIDTTMALHNEGAIFLLSHPLLPAGLIEPSADTEAELLDICRRHGCITHELELLL